MLGLSFNLHNFVYGLRPLGGPGVSEFSVCLKCSIYWATYLQIIEIFHFSVNSTSSKPQC